MKTSQIKQDLKRLAPHELKVRLEQMQQALFRLRFDGVSGHIKDYSQFKKLRRGIARINTFLRFAQQ